MFKIEYVDGDASGVVDFRFVVVKDVQTAEEIARLGMGEASAKHGAHSYRVRDGSGEIVARGR